MMMTEEAEEEVVEVEEQVGDSGIDLSKLLSSFSQAGGGGGASGGGQRAQPQPSAHDPHEAAAGQHPVPQGQANCLSEER
ncbi:hypothetical protein CRUP_010858 [Coryphaenoides rupestris]|nr:hypothetical protein CRUP_010858 [Coryphaenoides rupestris]